MTSTSPDSIIAVFEPHPYWGPELQRQFERKSIVIRECRTVNDLLPSIVTCSSALIVLDFDSAIEDCLAWLRADMRNLSHRWPIIACGSAATTEFEWVLRDAGVTAFLPDVISGARFGRLCRRQLGLHRQEKSFD